MKPEVVTVEIIERVTMDRTTGRVLSREPRSYRVLVDGVELENGEKRAVLDRIGAEVT